MRKALTYLSAAMLGIFCVAPPEFFTETSKMALAIGATDPTFKSDYFLPVMVNSFAWLFSVILVCGIGLFMVFNVGRALNDLWKAMIVYLFLGCFFSQVPYFSFNAYLLFIPAVILYLIFKECDFDVLVNMAQAVFWLEFALATLHFLGNDRLMNFGRTEPLFFGTINQHMRFASLLCILSPFLVQRTKFYIIPIVAAVFLTTSSGYALSVAAGMAAFSLLAMRKHKKWVLIGSLAFVVLYALTIGRDSFAVAIREGRLPVWWVCLKTWALDTRGAMGPPDTFGISQTGPVDWKSIFFGRGLDTFYSLFPAYKHDPAPFPQAHNDFIQVLWELGLVGFTIFMGYVTWLFVRLYRAKEYLLFAGLVAIAVNMNFHFPLRQPQTVLLVLAYVAYCEKKSEGYF